MVKSVSSYEMATAVMLDLCFQISWLPLVLTTSPNKQEGQVVTRKSQAFFYYGMRFKKITRVLALCVGLFSP